MGTLLLALFVSNSELSRSEELGVMTVSREQKLDRSHCFSYPNTLRAPRHSAEEVIVREAFT